MKANGYAVSAAIFFGLCANSQAATLIDQGVIQFTGSIVEPSCTAQPQASGWRLEGCPESTRQTGIDVRHLNPQVTVTALDDASVHVKLVADSGNEGRYYDQQYMLLDNAGKPITNGHYVLTLSPP